MNNKQGNIEQCKADIAKLREELTRLERTTPLIAMDPDQEKIAFRVTDGIADFIDIHRGHVVYLTPSRMNGNKVYLAYDFVSNCRSFEGMRTKFYSDKRGPNE